MYTHTITVPLHNVPFAYEITTDDNGLITSSHTPFLELPPAAQRLTCGSDGKLFAGRVAAYGRALQPALFILLAGHRPRTPLFDALVPLAREILTTIGRSGGRWAQRYHTHYDASLTGWYRKHLQYANPVSYNDYELQFTDRLTQLLDYDLPERKMAEVHQYFMNNYGARGSDLLLSLEALYSPELRTNILTHQAKYATPHREAYLLNRLRDGNNAGYVKGALKALEEYRTPAVARGVIEYYETRENLPHETLRRIANVLYFHRGPETERIMLHMMNTRDKRASSAANRTLLHHGYSKDKLVGNTLEQFSATDPETILAAFTKLRSLSPRYLPAGDQLWDRYVTALEAEDQDLHMLHVAAHHFFHFRQVTALRDKLVKGFRSANPQMLRGMWYIVAGKEILRFQGVEVDAELASLLWQTLRSQDQIVRYLALTHWRVIPRQFFPENEPAWLADDFARDTLNYDPNMEMIASRLVERGGPCPPEWEKLALTISNYPDTDPYYYKSLFVLSRCTSPEAQRVIAAALQSPDKEVREAASGKNPYPFGMSERKFLDILDSYAHVRARVVRGWFNLREATGRLIHQEPGSGSA